MENHVVSKGTVGQAPAGQSSRYLINNDKLKTIKTSKQSKQSKQSKISRADTID
jgi:hypothetical protein